MASTSGELTTTTFRPAAHETLLHTIAWAFVPLLCCIAFAIALQFAAGAYHSEFATYPDEPAHVITSLAVDQYARNGFPAPIHFFEDYYLHYPKVALGHWPPLLYAVEASASLLLQPSRASLLIVEAVLAGILAFLVFQCLRRFIGLWEAALGAAVFLCIPVVQTHTAMVMAEILLTLTMFLACLAFARFADTGDMRHALWFAVWASAAILTKGTGWALALVPPLVILFTRRPKLLFRPGLWLAGLTTLILCVPWQLATMRLASIGWADSSPGWRYTSTVLIPFTKWLFTVPGVPITALALVAVYFTIVRQSSPRDSALLACMLALIVADWVFHVMVPAGAEPRKLIMSVPAMFVLAGAGAQQLAKRIAPPRQTARVAMAIFGTAVVIAGILCFPITQKLRFGYIDAARSLYPRMPPNTAALVSTGAEAEGALISEFALLNPTPDRYLVRASKFLSSQNWDGSNYRSLIHSTDECSRILASVPVSFVVIDLRPEIPGEAHRIVRTLVTSRPAEWNLIGQFAPDPASKPTVAIYSAAQGPRIAQHLVINMQPVIGRELIMSPAGR